MMASQPPNPDNPAEVPVDDPIPSPEDPPLPVPSDPVGSPDLQHKSVEAEGEVLGGNFA